MIKQGIIFRKVFAFSNNNLYRHACFSHNVPNELRVDAQYALLGQRTQQSRDTRPKSESEYMDAYVCVRVGDV